MSDGTFFTTHTAHLIKEHVFETFFRCSVGIRSVIPLNDLSVYNKPVLIKYRLKCVNDSVFFTYVGTCFFDVDRLFGLFKVPPPCATSPSPSPKWQT